MKKSFLIVMLAFYSLSLFAQNKKSVLFSSDHISHHLKDLPNIKIGQKVPDVLLHRIMNYRDSSAALSDFYKGKLLIIDFWATWCPPCIKSLPVLDSIQNHFSDKLNIITVTYESQEKVKKTLKKNKRLNDISLPFITDDKLLNSYFKHRAVPHEVWIDSSGRVRGITNNYDITKDNIELLLHNSNNILKTKKDSMKFDPALYSAFTDSNILFRSVLAKSNPNLNGGWSDAKQQYTLYKRVFFTNRTPIQLFYSAFTLGYSPVINSKRIFYNTPDSSKYILIPHRERFNASKDLKTKYNSFEQWANDWMKSNTFCYELITKDYIRDSLFYKYMMTDLNRYFDIYASIEEKYMRCLVIELPTPSDSNLFKTKGGHPFYYWSHDAKRDTLKGVQNIKLSTVIRSLNSFAKIDPVVNGTGFSGAVDLELNVNGFSHHQKFNVSLLKNSLKKYGLKVSYQYKKVKVLVINKR